MCINQLSKMDKFVGHKVQLSSKFGDLTFNYNNFDYDLDPENVLILKDADDKDCKTYIRLELINSITNLINEDYEDALYKDVVTINYCDTCLNICCAEQKPTYPKCHKCGNEIKIPIQSIWKLEGKVNFGSHFDSPYNALMYKVHDLRFCDNCIYEFVGNIK